MSTVPRLKTRWLLLRTAVLPVFSLSTSPLLFISSSVITIVTVSKTDITISLGDPSLLCFHYSVFSYRDRL